MNKRLSMVACVCLLTSAASFAGSMGAETNDVTLIRDGFYIAGAIGAAGLVDKESHSSSPETHQLGAVGIMGGGYVGYEYAINNGGLAVEFFADATGLNAAITHDPDTYHHHQSYDVGIRVLPEYAFTPSTTGHIILGYTNGKFHISDNGVYGYIDTGYNKSGFQTGLGFATAIRDNLSIRVDAIYDIYASQTNTGAGLTAGTTQRYSNTFSTLAGELSLIYKFGG